MANASTVVYIILEVLLAAACCLGNALVVWGVKLNNSLRQPTFCFVVSLAVADFLVGAVAIPLAVLLENGLNLSFNGCLFICCVVVVLTQSSVLSLLAIAVDRYLRVRMALRYKRIATQSRSWVAVTVSWIIACILGLVPLFGWNAYHKNEANNSNIECKFPKVMSMNFMVYFNFFGCILVPLLLMVLIYLLVFHNIRKHLRDRESQPFYLREQRLATSLALVLTLFAVCWLPLHIINCTDFFSGPETTPQILLYAGILLSHANSAVNPIIYAFRIQKLRKAYLLVWRNITLCQREEVSHSDVTLDQVDGSNPNSTSLSDRSKSLQLLQAPVGLNKHLQN
ncbi:adenosine receptor A1-like [Scleropages formosus]|uniref:Adenosine A3 receptor a.1 n=1 Tax=Scleropages formosus TaxID=113540 RepID=A0A0P7U1Q3_SCLFO|nr:adenosine receptor A3-like [Scleropages formosus]KPP60645.1 adenosine receptor A1-like [Scleropages formosus]